MLCRNWPSLRVLLATVARTLRAVGDFAVLLALFIFIFALMGQSLFANRLRFDPDSGACKHVHECMRA